MPDITIKVDAQPATSLGSEAILDQDIVSYLRLNPNDLSAKEKEQIKDISFWLATQGESSMDKWQALRSLRFRLGSPALGNSEVDHIHKYIRLKQAVAEHEAKLEAMEQ